MCQDDSVCSVAGAESEELGAEVGPRCGDREPADAVQAGNFCIRSEARPKQLAVSHAPAVDVRVCLDSFICSLASLKKSLLVPLMDQQNAGPKTPSIQTSLQRSELILTHVKNSASQDTGL